MEGPSQVSPRASADPVVCPYLGLADDPRTHFAFATIDHRCHSGIGPKQIETTHQGSFCFTANYLTCRRFVAPGALAAASPAGPAAPATPARAAAPAVPLAAVPATAVPVAAASATAAAAVPTQRVTGPAPAQNRPAGQPAGTTTRRRSPARRAGILAVAILFAVVAAVFVSQRAVAPGGPFGGPGSSPTAGSTSPAGGSPSGATSSQGPTGTAPTGAGSSAGATPPTTHVVARGETLTIIASRYRVTVAAIEKANGLKDPNFIAVGQILIIPAP